SRLRVQLFVGHLPAVLIGVIYRSWMMGKKIVWAIIAVAAVVVVVLVLREQRLQSIKVRRSLPIEGAVIEHDTDTKKQEPIADVVITASDGVTSARTQSA